MGVIQAFLLHHLVEGIYRNLPAFIHVKFARHRDNLSIDDGVVQGDNPDADLFAFNADAHGVADVGCEGDGVAAAARSGFGQSQDSSVGEFAHNIRYRGWRQPSAPGNFGLRDTACVDNRRQYALLVGDAQG